MMELADIPDVKSDGHCPVRVRVSLAVLKN